MPYLGQFLSVALQTLSLPSAIALLTAADVEIQILRNNSRHISAFSDMVTCIVEKMQLIGYLLYLLQFLQSMVGFSIRCPTNLKRIIIVICSVIKECNSDGILCYPSAAMLCSCPSFG